MMTELFQQALHIDAPWLIKSIDFDADKKRLNICIDFKRGSTFSDPDISTGIAKQYKAYDTIQKKWKHLNFFEYECYLHIRVPRIKRDDGKFRLIPTPWQGKVSSFTLLFEALLIQLCKAMPVHNVSQLIGVSDHKIWRVLDTYIALVKKDEDYSTISAIGMDETYISKGHDYVTLFVDLVERKTLFISTGKDNKTVVNFVEELESKHGDRQNIKQVSCDMSPAFIKGIKENLPHAEITFDKFDIIKRINEAANQVHKEEAYGSPLLKGTRFIFSKNEANLTKKQGLIKARGYKMTHFKTIAYLLTGKLDFSKVNPYYLPT